MPPGTLTALEKIRSGDVPAELLGAIGVEAARTQQIPPAYSAIKQGGEAAHAKARRGETVVLEARPVLVHAIKLLDGGTEPSPWLAVALHVSKGYYVRSLARDIAAGLGTHAHLTALRRTASGNFTIAEALPLDTSGDELEARIIPLARAAERALPQVVLSEHAVREARFGRPVPLEDAGDLPHGPLAWFDPAGVLVAIGEQLPEGTGRVLRGFLVPSDP